MKIYLTIFTSLSLSLLAPLAAFAAVSSINLGATSNIQLTINGVTRTFIVTGNAEEITVNEANGSMAFSLATGGGSDVYITSTDRLVMSANVPFSFACGSSDSLLEVHRGSAQDAVTAVVSPSSATCSASNSSGSGGSSGTGGGGGGSYSYAATPPVVAPVVTPVAPTVAQPSPVAQVVSPVFNTGLGKGMSHPDVRRLQQLLNTDPDTQIADSGAGSPGNETELFGPATERAVQKFQEKYGLAKKGDSGYGLVGPKTRAKLQEIFGGVEPKAPEAAPKAPGVAEPSPVAQMVSPVFNKDLVRGQTNEDIKRLQELLAGDKELYPEGIVSGFFGPATERAVKRFQAKYGLPPVGRVGPATRAKLLEIFGKTEPTAEPKVEPKAPGVAEPSPVAQMVSPVFNRALTIGSRGEDVKQLQQSLNTDLDTKVADSGAGSPGNETELFGPATERAVQKFQEKYGLAKKGDSGYGLVGPKTRAKLQELFGGKSSAGPSSNSVSDLDSNTALPSPASVADSDEEAKKAALQKQLNDLREQLEKMLKRT